MPKHSSSTNQPCRQIPFSRDSPVLDLGYAIITWATLVKHVHPSSASWNCPRRKGMEPRMSMHSSDWQPWSSTPSGRNYMKSNHLQESILEVLHLRQARPRCSAK